MANERHVSLEVRVTRTEQEVADAQQSMVELAQELVNLGHRLSLRSDVHAARAVPSLAGGVVLTSLASRIGTLPPAWGVLALVAALVTVGLVTWWFWRSERDEPKSVAA